MLKKRDLSNLDATPTFQKSSKYIWDALYMAPDGEIFLS